MNPMCPANAGIEYSTLATWRWQRGDGISTLATWRSVDVCGAAGKELMISIWFDFVCDLLVDCFTFKKI